MKRKVIQKVIIALIFILLGCGPNFLETEEDDYIFLSPDKGNVIITNLTDRDIVIDYVFSSSIKFPAGGLGKPTVVGDINLPAKEEREFEILGYQGDYKEEFTVRYYFADCDGDIELYYLTKTYFELDFSSDDEDS